MGQKVNPIGFRIGINKNWFSRWFSSGDNYSDWIHEDYKIRKIIEDNYLNCFIGKVEIIRTMDKCIVNVFTSRPGIVIGRGGKGIEQLKYLLNEIIESKFFLKIYEIKRRELDAKLVAENVANQILKRISFRRAMKKAMMFTMKFGAKGIKILCSGKLGGVDMSRKEWYKEGKIPLHTIRADIDYGFAEAKTNYGVIGCKVWIYKGDVIVSEFKNN